MKIAFIGAGNLATNFGMALFKAGCDITQVYSRTEDAAMKLSSLLGASPITNIEDLNNEADIYIFALKDSVIADIIPYVCKDKKDKIFLHTAGSVSVDIFKGTVKHYGVFYPMQTFSKAKLLDFNDITCFIEASDEYTNDILIELGSMVSDKVYPLDSEARKSLHLAAVFACNFVNHCYEISSELLARHGLSFDIMLPLIDETALKVHAMSPLEAQTGPAKRYDQNIIRAQSDLLKDNPIFKQIYECMSLSINRVEKLKNK